MGQGSFAAAPANGSWRRLLPAWVALMALVALALLSTACGDRGRPGIRSITQEAAAPGGARRVAGPRIALIMKTLTNPFFLQVEQGARRAEREGGVDLQVRAPTLESMVEQQIQLVEDEIQAQTRAIVITPSDSTRLVPVLKRAQDAGIRLVNLDNRLNPEAMAAVGMTPPPFISVDNEMGAYLVAKYAADRIKVPTEAAILEGLRVADNAQRRRQGAERGFRGNPAIRIVAREQAEWNLEKAYVLTKQIFRDHPRVGLVFCANDMMAFGAIKFLQESGRSKVMVVGFDALDEAVTAIRARQLLGSVDQQATEQGYLGIMAALKLLRGEVVPAETWTSVKLVTAETLP